MDNLIEEEDGNAEFDLVVHPEKQPSPVSVQSGRARKLTYQEEPADHLLKASYNPFAIDQGKDNDFEQEEDGLILVADPTTSN